MQRIDLLVDLHRADLRGEGAARAAGDDDRGEQDADLAQDRDAEQVDGVDLGAEAAQLVGALVGHHDADQERDQADDRQRVDAGLLEVMGERGQPQPARLQRDPRQSEHRLAIERQQPQGLVAGHQRAAAEPRHDPQQRIDPARPPAAAGCGSRRISPSSAACCVAQAGELDLPAAAAEIALELMQQPGADGVERLERARDRCGPRHGRRRPRASSARCAASSCRSWSRVQLPPASISRRSPSRAPLSQPFAISAPPRPGCCQRAPAGRRRARGGARSARSRRGGRVRSAGRRVAGAAR